MGEMTVKGYAERRVERDVVEVILKFIGEGTTIDKLLNINSCRTLAGFEILYRKSDLMYYYCSRFNRGELDGIIEMKHAISIKIMEKLQEMRQVPIVVG